jgi:cullin-5
MQDSAMKLVHAERNGEAFDSQLVIGISDKISTGYLVHP